MPRRLNRTAQDLLSDLKRAFLTLPRMEIQNVTDLDKTTVILPTFNRAALLVETLQSLFAQTLLPAEIIVVDDGSTDDTALRMQAFEGRVQYIQKANSGKADTLNQVLPLATHPLIWIMDDDDLVLPHALETLTRMLQDRPDLGFAYGRYERFFVDPASQQIVRYHCGHWRTVPSEDFLLVTMQDFFAHHPGLLVRKSVYEQVGPFSLKFTRSEDYEMLIRIARAARGIGTDEIVFLQRQHDGVRTGGLVGEDQRFARWKLDEQGILTEVRLTRSLHDFLPRGSTDGGPLTHAQTREALIARGSIMCRKRLWDFAFEDFRAACAINELEPDLTPREISSIRMALFSKYSCPEIVTDPSIGRRIIALRGEGQVGKAIAKAFARSLVWFVRRAAGDGKLKDAAYLSRLATELVFAPKRATTP